MKKSLIYSICGLMILLQAARSLQLNAQTIADKIPATYDVGPTGAFTYTVPLRIPPGIKDIMPNLAINYNSQGGNGLLGIGWNITGLSTITRTSQTIHHDETISPIDFTDDGYALDGQRMFETSSGSGIYLTEIKNFAKIEEHAVGGLTGPGYFTVEHTNGVVYEYGRTSSSANSAMTIDASNEIFMWALSKVYDRSGNYILFEYDTDSKSGTFYITGIKYTGNSNASVLPSSEIAFYYTPKNDKNKVWVYGSVLEDNDILDYIEIKHNSAVVNKYEFTYTTNPYSLLTQIQETRGSTQLPPIDITWGQNSDPAAVWPTGNYNTNTLQAYSIGDYNGDGYSDYLMSPQTSTLGSNMDIYINTKQNGFNTTSWNEVQPFVTGSNIFDMLGQKAAGRMGMDWNGDGFDDVLLFSKENVTSGPYGVFRIHLFLSDGDDLTYQGPIFEYSNNSTFGTYMDYINDIRIVPGDFDGNKLPDIIVMLPNGLTSGFGNGYDYFIVSHAYPNGPTNNPSGNYGNITFGCHRWLKTIGHAVWDAKALDFDGDGKDELLITSNAVPGHGDGCEIFTLPVTYPGGIPTFTPGSALVNIYNSNFPSIEHRMYQGDFNGDRKTDLLLWSPVNTQTGQWDMVYSTGTAFRQFSPAVPSVISSNLYHNAPRNGHVYSFHIADFDGDGKDDIVQIHDPHHPNYANGEIYYDIFYSRGDNVFDHESGQKDHFSARAQNLALGDFNGDGQADLLAHMSGTGNNQQSILTFHENNNALSVIAIEHAGKELSITSQSVIQENIYEYEGSYFYPNPQRPVGLRVVKELKDNFSLEKTYTYGGLTMNLSGKGFLGFRYMSETDVSRNRFTQYIFRPEFFNRLEYTIAWDKDVYDNMITTYGTMTGKGVYSSVAHTLKGFHDDKQALPLYISKNTYLYYDGGASGKCQLERRSRFEEFDLVNGLNTATAGESPGYTAGTPFYEIGKETYVTSYSVSQDHAGNNERDIQQETRYGYNLNGPFYNRSKPTEVDVTSTILVGTVGAPYTRTTDFQYNSEGLVSEEISDPGTANENTTTFTYDVFGNLETTEKTSANIGGTINNAYGYSSDGRFMIESENTLGYTNNYTHDLWGNLLTHTDINNLTTSYQYDALNRKIQVTNPSSAVENITYDWAANAADKPTFATAQFVVTSSVSGISNTSQTFYDFYNRAIRQVSVDFEGHKIFNDNKYYNNGLLEYTKGPYRLPNVNNAVTINYTYDGQGREIQRTNSAGGATINTSYENIFVYRSAFLKFPTGMETSRTNAATGRETTTTTGGDGKTVIVVDNANLNTMQYVYHSNGNVSKIKLNSNKNLERNYAYDPYGRLISKTEPNAGLTQYDYNSRGQLIEEEDANGTVFNYNYDDLGRLIQRTGPDGSYDYVYDNTVNPGNHNTGKLITATAPSSYNTELSYQYNNLGLLEESTEMVDGNSFVNTYTYDSWNRLETRTYPTDDEITHNYNSYGYLASIDLSQSPNLTQQTLWQKTKTNDLGLTTESEYYSASSAIYTSLKTYHPLGFLTEQQVMNNSSGDPIQYYEYSYDLGSSNLISRRDAKWNLDEEFSYDLDFDRLENVNPNVPNVDPVAMTYSPEGNILSKTDVSISNHPWKYDAYGVTLMPEPQTSSPAYEIPKLEQNITYHPFRKVKDITENGAQIRFTYGPDDTRMMAQWHNPGMTKVRYYLNDYEQTIDMGTGNMEDVCYIQTGDETIAMLYHKTGTNSQVLYTFTDKMGSLTQIADNEGLVNDGLLEERSFDAWGRVRDPQTWIPITGVGTPPVYLPPNWLIDRGYTGHEHIWTSNHTDNYLINMNGRLYDPLVGRMLSPDPVLPSSTNADALNEYTYAFNNPLKYIDPDGEDPVFIAIGIGAVLAGGMYTYQVSQSEGGFKNWNWSQFAYQTIAGGVMGGLGYGWGSAIGPVGVKSSYIGKNLLLTEAVRAGGHGMISYVGSGGNSKAAMAGAFGSAAGSLAHFGEPLLNSRVGSLAVSAGVGGIAAEIAGGDFWEGAGFASITYLANHALHDGDGDGDGKGKGEGKGNKFRGGKQKDRDRDTKKYPQDFIDWLHLPNNHDDYYLPGQPDQDLGPIYEEWKDLGSPSSFSPLISSKTGLTMFNLAFMAKMALIYSNFANYMRHVFTPTPAPTAAPAPRPPVFVPGPMRGIRIR